MLPTKSGKEHELIAVIIRAAFNFATVILNAETGKRRELGKERINLAI